MADTVGGKPVVGCPTPRSLLWEVDGSCCCHCRCCCRRLARRLGRRPWHRHRCCPRRRPVSRSRRVGLLPRELLPCHHGPTRDHPPPLCCLHRPCWLMCRVAPPRWTRVHPRERVAHPPLRSRHSLHFLFARQQQPSALTAVAAVHVEQPSARSREAGQWCRQRLHRVLAPPQPEALPKLQRMPTGKRRRCQHCQTRVRLEPW